jgi:hypothetical protein
MRELTMTEIDQVSGGGSSALNLGVVIPALLTGLTINSNPVGRGPNPIFVGVTSLPLGTFGSLLLTSHGTTGGLVLL